MNMFEQARTIKGMIAMCSLTQSEIAQRMGVSQSYVANKIRLLNFSLGMQEKILESGISERHARSLLRLAGTDMEEAALEKIKSMKLTVAQTEALVDNMQLDNISSSVALGGTREKIERLEEIISAGVKNLAACGIKVKKKTEYYSKMRYITVSIDEN